MNIQKSEIAILVLNQSPISAIFQKTALTGESLYKYYLAGNIDCFFQRGLEASKEEKQKLLATTYVTKSEEKVECPRYFVTRCVVLYNFSDCSTESTFVNMFGCLKKQTYFQTYLL